MTETDKKDGDEYAREKTAACQKGSDFVIDPKRKHADRRGGPTATTANKHEDCPQGWRPQGCLRPI